MSVVVITESNFEQEVLKSDKPVLLDFWAVWCGPCKMLSPLVDQIAEETDEIKGSFAKARLAAIEIITSPAITLFFFAGGIIIARNIP